MKKYVLLWACTFCFLFQTPSSQAATISTISGLVTIGAPSSKAGNIDFDALSPYGLSALTDKTVSIPTSDSRAEGKLITSFAGITNSSDLLATKPVGTVGSNFLAIYSLFGHDGSATFNFTNAPTLVSFNIGTLDRGNSLTVVDTSDDRYTLTGAQLLAAAAADGTIASKKSGQSTVFLSLFSLKGIAQIILSTTKDKVMEISNMTAVPLPGAIVLFGTALVGIKRMRRKSGK